MSIIKTRKKELLEEIMQRNLLRSALELLMRGGWDNVTMKEVAKEAGVSKGTIYNYFKDKRDLMGQLMKDLAKPYVNTFKSIVDSDLGADLKIEKMIDYALWDLFEHKELIKAIMEVHIKIHGSQKMDDFKKPDMVPIQIQRMIKKVIQQGQEEGQFENISPTETAIFIQGGLMNAMNWCTLFGEELDLKSLQDSFKKLIFKGLSKGSDVE